MSASKQVGNAEERIKLGYLVAYIERPKSLGIVEGFREPEGVPLAGQALSRRYKIRWVEHGYAGQALLSTWQSATALHVVQGDVNDDQA